MVFGDRTYSGYFIVIPIIVGAFLSGIVYLSEGSAIPFTLFQMALISGFFLFVLIKIVNQDLELEVYGAELEYLLLLALIFLSLIYSSNRDVGLFNAVRFITLLSMTYLIYNSINKASELFFIIKVVIVVGCIVALKSVYDAYSNPEIIAFNYLNEGKKLMRSSGVEADPNVFAIGFSMPFMLLLSYLLQAKSVTSKALIAIGLVLVLGAVLITYSRSTWVAFFIGGGIIFKYYKNYTIVIAGVVFVIIAAFVSESVYAIFISIWQRAKDIFAGSDDDSSNIRIMLFIGAIRMFWDSYMLGVGFQGFSANFQHYYTKQETIGVNEPHNEYYKFLSELGLVGFVLFIMIIAKFIKVGLNNLNISNDTEKSIAIALLCSLISYLIFYIFYSGMLYNALFFINIALLFVLRKVLYKNKLNPAISS